MIITNNTLHNSLKHKNPFDWTTERFQTKMSTSNTTEEILSEQITIEGEEDPFESQGSTSKSTSTSSSGCV